MPELPERTSPTAARILAAAGDLLLRRGSRAVTISEVAERARVGKGTVYLYWASKTDLLLGLVARDFLALAEEFTALLREQPDMARPSLLFPALLRTTPGRPFVRAMLREDDDLLGALTADPRAAALTEALGPESLMMTVLPSWRRGRLATEDVPLAEQSYAVLAVFRGFLLSHHLDELVLPSVDPPEVFGKSMARLLGEGPSDAGGVADAARTIEDYLEKGRSLVIEMIR